MAATSQTTETGFQCQETQKVYFTGMRNSQKQLYVKGYSTCVWLHLHVCNTCVKKRGFFYFIIKVRIYYPSNFKYLHKAFAIADPSSLQGGESESLWLDFSWALWTFILLSCSHDKTRKNILGISIDTIKFSWNTIAMVLMGCLFFFWFILSSTIHLISWILCSWNIGPAHIISYSTEVYFWLQYGIEQIVQQYNWLIRDLEVKKYSLHYPCICFFVAFSCLSTSSVVPFLPSFSPFSFIHSLLPLPSTSPKLFFFCVIICSFKGWVMFSVCPRFFSIQL